MTVTEFDINNVWVNYNITSILFASSAIVEIMDF